MGSQGIGPGGFSILEPALLPVFRKSFGQTSQLRVQQMVNLLHFFFFLERNTMVRVPPDALSLFACNWKKFHFGSEIKGKTFLLV